MKKWQMGALVAGVLVIGLSIGVGVSYLIVNNNKKEEVKPTVSKQEDLPPINLAPVSTNVTTASLKVSQDPNNPVVKPEEKWTGEITLAPKNASQMKKTVYDGKLELDPATTPPDKNYSCTLRGLVSYDDQMNISNTNLFLNRKVDAKTDFFDKAKNYNDSFYNQITYGSGTNFFEPREYFTLACAGAATIKIKQKDVTLKGADSTIAMLTLWGQQYPGGLAIDILSYKGNNMIWIPYLFQDTDGFNAFDISNKKCGDFFNQENTNTDRQNISTCLFNILKTDPDLAKVFDKKVDELLAKYTLE